MHDAGVRGIRFNLSPPGATTLDMIEPLAKRIEPMGWHCQINAPADQILAAQEIFLRVPGRLVFDHWRMRRMWTVRATSWSGA